MASGERVYTGSRWQKLGARRGLRALLLHIPDPTLESELEDAGVEVLDKGAAVADLVFLGVASVAELDRIRELKPRLAKEGALWVIRPKGKNTPVHERALMDAGLDAGLVDVKVVNFSGTHSAMKFVYRLRDR